MLEVMSVKATLLWTLGAVLLIVGYALYEFRSSSVDKLHTDPRAADEIEKAKQR